jgi:hypothetical protein
MFSDRVNHLDPRDIVWSTTFGRLGPWQRLAKPQSQHSYGSQQVWRHVLYFLRTSVRINFTRRPYVNRDVIWRYRRQTASIKLPELGQVWRFENSKGQINGSPGNKIVSFFNILIDLVGPGSLQLVVKDARNPLRGRSTIEDVIEVQSVLRQQWVTNTRLNLAII